MKPMNTDSLINLATVYAHHVGQRLSTVGAYAVNDGKFFERLSAGRSCTFKTAEKAVRYFDAVWPADLDWPRDIPRPRKSSTKEAA